METAIGILILVVLAGLLIPVLWPWVLPEAAFRWRMAVEWWIARKFKR